MMGDIIIRYMELPVKVKAFTLTDPNDDYNIYVNSAISSIEQKKAVDHELHHIQSGHFHRDTSVLSDEKETEAKLNPKSAAPTFPTNRQKDNSYKHINVALPDISPQSPAYLYKLTRRAGISDTYIAKALGLDIQVYNIYRFNNDKCPPHIRYMVEKLVLNKIQNC